MGTERRIYLAGKWVSGETAASIRAPFDGQEVASVHQASWQQIDEALAVASAARGPLAAQPAGDRRRLCQGISDRLAARAEEFARAICLEAGKPITAARTEVARAVTTFALAAAEATGPTGETMAADLDPAVKGYFSVIRRVPVGVVVGISPFNFPLNLTAHKVAPALAVGAPILLKPPPQAPSAALLLAELAQECGALPGALSVLPCSNELAERMATDARVRLLSFTGSAKVGWSLKSKVRRAEVVLELGGNAAVVVCEDADLPWAIQRIATGAFAYSGQVCISVQRVFAHRAIAAQLVEGILDKARGWLPGDPSAEATVVGPLIDEGAARRIEGWLQAASAAGAKVVGGSRRGNQLTPAVVQGAPQESPLVREEIFGPVVLIDPYEDFDRALTSVNDSDYGLQAGLFTQDLTRVRQAFERLEVGGLIVNDAPTFRADNMPYGGVKGSGLGREGVRYAAQAFTEPRVMVWGGRPSSS